MQHTITTPPLHATRVDNERTWGFKMHPMPTKHCATPARTSHVCSREEWGQSNKIRSERRFVTTCRFRLVCWCNEGKSHLSLNLMSC